MLYELCAKPLLQVLARLQPQDEALRVGAHLDEAVIVDLTHETEERLLVAERHALESPERREVSWVPKNARFGRASARATRRAAAAYGVAY